LFDCVLIAGSDVITECHKHIKFNDDLLPGHVYVSIPGRLPNKCIIHTHAKKWRVDIAEDAENYLVIAISKAIETAIEKGSKSVAIPAKFAEFFRFPPDIAVRIIVNCVEAELKAAGRVALKEVYIVDSNQTELDKFKAALDAIKTLKVKTSEESETKGSGRRVTIRAEGSSEPTAVERMKSETG